MARKLQLQFDGTIHRMTVRQNKLLIPPGNLTITVAGGKIPLRTMFSTIL